MCGRIVFHIFLLCKRCDPVLDPLITQRSMKRLLAQITWDEGSPPPTHSLPIRTDVGNRKELDGD